MGSSPRKDSFRLASLAFMYVSGEHFSSYLGGVSREIPLKTSSPPKIFSLETSALSLDISQEQKLQPPPSQEEVIANSPLRTATR
jgi:hypothetical protein